MRIHLTGFFFSLLQTLSGLGQQPKVLSDLNALVDGWHKDATLANFDNYFNRTAHEFIFLGTAPGERWTKEEFQAYAKPYFEKKQTWRFTPSQRTWHFSPDQKVAWFDESLETWMLDCRGSGVCVKTKKGWKISYYNLTVLIENEKIKEFIELRKN